MFNKIKFSISVTLLQERAYDITLHAIQYTAQNIIFFVSIDKKTHQISQVPNSITFPGNLLKYNNIHMFFQWIFLNQFPLQTQ